MSRAPYYIDKIGKGLIKIKNTIVFQKSKRYKNGVCTNEKKS